MTGLNRRNRMEPQRRVARIEYEVGEVGEGKVVKNVAVSHNDRMVTLEMNNTRSYVEQVVFVKAAHKLDEQ